MMHSSVLTSSDYINELSTLTECNKKIEIFVKFNPIGIKMISEPIEYTGYAGAEVRNQMYRKEIIEVF